MAELVGGALLSAFFQALSARLDSEEVKGLFQGKQAILELVDELGTVLISANKLLNDAEEKQIGDENVRKWLNKLKDVIFQADDLVDAMDSEALRRKVEGESSCTKIKVLHKVNSVVSGFHSTIKNEATVVLRKLKVLLDQKVALGLREGVENILTSQRSSAPLVEESSVYGRKEDKKAIVDLLLSGEDDGDKMLVIPIVGMGGIGKTTLAQLVYDDESVAKHFDVRAWVTVSDKFDVFKITKVLFEKVDPKTRFEKVDPKTRFEKVDSKIRFEKVDPKTRFEKVDSKTRFEKVNSKILFEKVDSENNLFELQRKLKEALRGKKFLFVLDDVWNENYHCWNDLKSSFDSAERGSKILITSRSTGVSSVMGNGPTYNVSNLSPEDGWHLFSKHAFGNNVDPNSHQQLQAIGREIVDKCKGLPLAIKSLGGLLCSERNLKKWENILKSDVWDELYKNEGNILPALWLSYRHMPTNLKRCFSYCSIFPKDFKFEKEKVILLWMAEGFLESDKSGTRTMEELGLEYFEDLLSRSMFQKSAQDASILVMHDLIHDLAMFVSGGFCFTLDDKKANDLPNLSKQTRYFSYDRGVRNSEVLEGIHKAKCLRNFIRLPLLVPHESFHVSRLPHEFLLAIRFLRVLCLRGSSITKLSGSIGNLINLRYLDVSYSKIRKLPNSVCTLYNLQTLLLSWCENLGGLPKNMKMLINLRHLDIEGVPLKTMPFQLSEMKSLQTLSKIVVGDGNRGVKISALKKVQPFCGALEISGIENICSSTEGLEANLRDMKSLTSLSLGWSYKGSTNESNSQGREREILDSLRPHTNLKKLRINFYRGTVFSDWVVHDSFTNVVTIRLEDCGSCCSLPPLGQLPSLKELTIHGFYSVVTIGDEFCGNSPSFRCLEKMEIAFMPKLNKWSLSEDIKEEDRGFPRLAVLKLSVCPLLNISFSGYLLSLVELDIVYCPELGFLLDWVSHSELKRLLTFASQKVLPQDFDLRRLSSLDHLSVLGCEDKSFPRDGLLLPTGLTELGLGFSANLEALNSNAFRQLTALEKLFLWQCPKLRCLPEQGLPASLTSLHVCGCPHLKRRCQKDRGEDWPKIENIAEVSFE